MMRRWFQQSSARLWPAIATTTSTARRMLSTKSKAVLPSKPSSATAATADASVTTTTTTASGLRTIGEQAPNRVATWSASQMPRAEGMSGPRFEQIDLATQPNAPAAIEMIAQQPVIKVAARVACCDGGGGALGHPKVYINLDRGVVEDCGYCGLRFQMYHHHH